MNLNKIILDFLSGFLKFFIPVISRESSDLLLAAKGVKARYIFSDTLNMLLNAKMLLFFNIAACLVFTILPAGKDVLLIVAEELSRYNFANYIWLMFGVTVWSIISEYAVRYSIYVTDNSGHSLSAERILFRKSLQRGIANLYLSFPFMIILVGLLINYLEYGSLFHDVGKYFAFGIPALSLLLIFSRLSKFYFDTKFRNEFRALQDDNIVSRNFFKRYAKTSAYTDPSEINTEKTKSLLSPLYNFLILPAKEAEWARRLLGIYNDYVYTLPTAENYDGNAELYYKKFSNLFSDKDKKESRLFPQSVALNADARVPKEFVLKAFQKDSGNDEDVFHEIDCKEDDKARYKWIYEIPVTFFPQKKASNNDIADPCFKPRIDFYARLHNQLRAIVLISVLIITIVVCLPVRWLDIIGPPGLVCLAFAAWSGIYVGLLFIDYAVLRKAAISVRFVLLLVLILSSYFNNDHPYRHSEGILADHRPTLQEHFKNWVTDYKKDSSNLFFTMPCNGQDSTRYPVVFICAEGGALRTGAYSALGLGYLQDSLSKNMHYDFRKSIYAFSSVSGGSLGLSLFNAMGYLQDSTQLRPYSYDSLAKSFFNIDFLSPVLGKMFYSEIIQLFLPFHVESFDRAIALERAWELGFSNVVRHDAPSVFDKSYQTIYSKQHVFPAFFINTTEAETGLQCFISNVKPVGFLKAEERDLLNDSMYHKIDHSLLYSTAVNFSSRFPLISPAAAAIASDGRSYHYIDGGYIENTGAATMLELLKSLKPLLDKEHIMPFVAVLKFSDDANDDFVHMRFGNELTEIVGGIYNTRKGRTNMALEDLQRFTEKELDGKFIKLSLEKTSADVPTNWALSEKSIDHIQKDIERKWKERYTNKLAPAFFLDTLHLKYARASDSPYIKIKNRMQLDKVATDSIMNKVELRMQKIRLEQNSIDSLRNELDSIYTKNGLCKFVF